VRATTIVIGAGHSGLAMSARLTERSIDHVVLERGQVANSWRNERWDSLRLLTPNWQSRLPGMSYEGDDPDGFMAVPEIVAFIDSYAVNTNAPVVTGTAVSQVAPTSKGYQVTTSKGIWDCETLVVASGAANLANVPSLAAAVPNSIEMVTPMTYRSPECLDQRGVLVVGASATGVQLADEIHRSGRPVTISVGEHVRLPRAYRGYDVFWWMEAAGILEERHDEVDDIIPARHVPSPQLIGTPEHRSIDLNALGQLGVEIVGRLCSIRDGVAQFSGGLTNSCRLADLKMNRLLNRFDTWAHSEKAEVFDPPHRFEPIRTPSAPTLEIDLCRQGIGTIVWATGYHADYSWLDLPVLDYKGQIRHLGGIVGNAPGMYLLGGNLLRARRSSYISGAVNDTDGLATHLYTHLSSRVHPTGVRRAQHGALQADTCGPS
jgi:putative flavoprotein involved in K+ transport